MADSYMFFLPEMSIYPYARMLSLYADALQRQSKSVFFLTCNGGLDTCWPRNWLIEAGKEASASAMARCCAECRRNQNVLRQRYGFSVAYLEDQLSADDLQVANGIVANYQSLKECVYDGVTVGIQAQYDLILLFKDCDLELTPLVKDLLQRQILANIKISMAVKNLAKKASIRAVVYTQNYNAQAALRNACSKESLDTFQIDTPLFLGYGANRNYISKHILRKEMDRWLQYWGQVSSLPISEKNVKDCFSDVYFRNFGANSHLFSPNKGKDPQDILDKLSLAADRKLLVAYTSSTDEIAAAESICSTIGYTFPFRHIFSSQVEWIKALAEYADRRGYQLVVRIHPRMGAVGKESPQLVEFQQALVNLPECCRIIWPKDPISSYDLAELADVALTSWSTMSQELSRIGVPCMAATKTSAYPDASFLRCPSTSEEYFRQLDAVLNGDYTFKYFVEAVRFSNFTLAMTPFIIKNGVSQQFPPSIFHDKPIPRIPDEQLSAVQSFFEGTTSPLELNIAQLQKNLGSDSALAEEKAAIFDGVGHFMESTFAPREASGAQMVSGIKERIKKHIPAWLLDVIRKVRTLKQRICPGDFVRELHIPYWDNRKLYISTDTSAVPALLAATSSDHSLRILLVVDESNVTYFSKGQALPRTSKLMARLGRLMLENYACRWGLS